MIKVQLSNILGLSTAPKTLGNSSRKSCRSVFLFINEVIFGKP